MAIIDREAVEAWLQGDEATAPFSDAELDAAYPAALAYVTERTVIAEGAAPDSLKLAVCLLTRRYIGRREAWNGLAGLGEGLVGRIPGTDPDVERLIDPHRGVVTA